MTVTTSPLYLHDFAGAQYERGGPGVEGAGIRLRIEQELLRQPAETA
jgi:hypothetical protein